MLLTPEIRASIEAAEANASGDTQSCPIWTRTKLLSTADRTRPTREYFGREILFNNVELLEEDKIELDLLYDSGDVPAPFACPCGPTPNASFNEKHATLSIEPAYVKWKDTIRYCKRMRRYPGERPWSSLTKAEKAAAEFQYKTDKLRNGVFLREEMSIWEQLRTGKMIHYETDYNTGISIAKNMIDFKRSKHLSNFKFKWDKKAECIGQDLTTIYRTMDCEGGDYVTDLVGGYEVCDAIKYNKDFKEQVKCAGEAGIPELMDVDLDFTPRARHMYGKVELIGRIGDVRLWCNTAYYKCPRTNEKINQIEPNRLIALSRTGSQMDMGGTRVYGAIMLCDELVPMPVHMHTWVDPEGTQRSIKAESSPFPAMMNPNSTASMLIQC